MKKSKNSVQGLIGLERFTRFGVKTDQYFRAVCGEYRREDTSLYDAVKHDPRP